VSTLRAFAEDLWIADGPVVRFFGAPYPTRMMVVKLGNGSLWVNSPVISTPEVARALEELGPVAHLVSPTRLHDWRLEASARFFPQAKLWKAAMLNDTAPAAWEGDLEQMRFRGSFVLTETEFFHPRSRTLLVGDFLQNFQPKPGHELRNAFMRFGGILQGGAPCDLRLSFLPGRLRREGQDSLRRMLAWDFDRLVPAHGDCVSENAKAFVERSFRWLCG
jgi:hypothetical protein